MLQTEGRVAEGSATEEAPSGGKLLICDRATQHGFDKCVIVFCKAFVRSMIKFGVQVCGVTFA